MTPYERASRIANQPWSTLTTGELQEQIHRAILDATNDEIIKRRETELLLEGVIAGGVHIVATKSRTELRVWNPVRKRFASINLIEEGPGES